MSLFRIILAALLLCAAPAQAQTLKSLMYNTTNGQVVYSSLSSPTFSNGVVFGVGDPIVSIDEMGVYLESNITNTSAALINFVGDGADRMAQNTRANLGLGATWLTNTNVTNFRTAIGLGATSPVVFQSIVVDGDLEINGTAIKWGGGNKIDLEQNFLEGGDWVVYGSLAFNNTTNAAITRTNLGLGATNATTFAGLTNNGDITINQTATNNGLLYIRRTNAEPFLGLANLIASNNTTSSNETLFRVGVSEATNKAAQFGFRSTNTNGNGVAVFSVFGYNALMMIGPSDPNAGTNPIQATVYSIAPTNKVMTLITTNTGAMQMHRPIGIDTAGVSTNAPANTTNVAGWIQFYVGTNSVRVPYYQ